MSLARPPPHRPRHEQHETNPLMPGNQSQDRDGEVSHNGSIYTYMLFMPIYTRKVHGHFCTWEVPLAFALFALSVTLQLCLTLIAGSQIVEQQHEMRMTLIHDSNLTGTYLSLMWDQLDYLSHESQQLEEKVKRTLRHTLIEEAEDQEAITTEECCIGAQCSGLKRCCSSTTVAKPVSHVNASTWGRVRKEASFMASGRPSGKGKSRADEEEAADEEDVPPATAAICSSVGGVLSCMPPSTAMLGAWDRLDLDGDGQWTLAEAQRDAANFGCQIGAQLEDIFRAACRGIVKDSEDTAQTGSSVIFQIPQVIERREAIPRAYFEWWRGTLAMCIDTDPTMCGDVIVRGTFDGAVTKHANASRGGVVDLDSALSYCERMLSPGGVCDNALPGSYVLYRARIRERCGVPNPSAGPRYVNPSNPGDVVSTLTTTWSEVEAYATTHKMSFRFFMVLILVLWYVNLVDELKSIIHLWDFLHNFPVDEGWPFTTPRMDQNIGTVRRVAFNTVRKLVEDCATLQRVETPAETPADTPRRRKSKSEVDDEEAIDFSQPGYCESIARPHQLTIVGMATVRSILLAYLAYAGTYFLLSNRSYIDLLLNALALAFIFELDEFLFVFLVPEQTKNTLEDMAPIKYNSSLPSSGIAASLLMKHMWGLLFIPALSWLVVRCNDYNNTVPMLEALECACDHVGDRCLAPAMFSKSWWDQYWAEMALLRSQGDIAVG